MMGLYSKEKELYYLDLKFITDFFEEISNDNVIYYSEDRLTGKIIRSRNRPKEN